MAVGSIVDYLKGQGQDSSYGARAQMAQKYGIQNYKGTAAQNTQLLGALRSGRTSSASNGPSGTATVGAAPNAPAAVTAGTPGTGPGISGTTTTGSASGSTTVKRNYNRSDRVNNLYDRAMSAAGSIPDDYDPSDDVLRYKDKLQDVEDNKPGPFQSKYTDMINNVLQGILNNKEFSYTGKDLMNDDLYKMYSDMYTQNARKSMQDAMGNAQAMTGGYGSTYSQAAGQQAYDNQMSQMNAVALELADRAYDRYLNQQQDRYNQMGVLTGLDNTDYGRYRDTVGDWKDDRNYYANRYDSEYARDYGEYRDSVADAQNNRDFWAGMYDTEHDNDFGEYQSDLAESQWNQEFAHQKEMDAAQLAIQQAAEARAAEAWELEKQQMQRAAAGGSGGGSGRRRSSGSRKSSSSSKNTTTQKNYGGFTPLDLAQSKVSGGSKWEQDYINFQINPAWRLNAPKVKEDKVLENIAKTALSNGELTDAYLKNLSKRS